MNFLKKIFGNKKEEVKQEEVNMVDTLVSPYGLKVGHTITFDNLDLSIHQDDLLMDINNVENVIIKAQSSYEFGGMEFFRLYTEFGFIEFTRDLGEEEFNDTVVYFKKVHSEILEDIESVDDIYLTFGEDAVIDVNDVKFNRLNGQGGLIEVPKIDEKIVQKNGDIQDKKLYSLPFEREVNEDLNEYLIQDIVDYNDYYEMNIYVGVEFSSNQFEII